MFTTPIECPDKKPIDRQQSITSHNSARSWDNDVDYSKKHISLGSRDSGFESCIELKKQGFLDTLPLKIPVERSLSTSDCVENTYSCSKKRDSFEDPEQLGFSYDSAAKRKTDLPNCDTNLTSSEAADRLRFMRHYNSCRWKR